ncbi:MAG TPA: glycosyltransferase family 4 protein [Stellaceae bacterium]|nr:glycosyltransferase family 4 protein [Stellaceae bacterium]
MPRQRRYRLAFLSSHPVQYHVPLLRLIAAQPDIELKVFYQSEGALHGHLDTGFKQIVRWDIPLLDGYEYEFLPAIGRRDLISAQRPASYGLFSRLRRGRFDALLVNGYARWVNWQAMIAARAVGTKVLVRDEATADSTARPLSRRIANQFFFSLLSSVADAFLAVGTANREYYLANGVRRDRIFMLPYAVDIDFFAKRAQEAAPRREQFRAELGLEPGRAIILYASKYERRKRPDDLLRAYERLCRDPGVRSPPYLLFVGAGEMEAELQQAVREKGLADVRFLGFRNQTELPALFDLAEVLVLPSVHEAWGTIVQEAIAAGSAVIAAHQVGCTRDIVRQGVNGFFFTAGDIDALTAALREIVVSPERARAMGAASRDIIARWSFREDIDGLRKALSVLCGNRV